MKSIAGERYLVKMRRPIAEVAVFNKSIRAHAVAAPDAAGVL
jgi:hypothetical protein